MNAKKTLNILFFAVIIYVLYLKAPAIVTHFKFQYQKAPNFSVTTVKNEKFTLHDQTKKTIIIFWASWCGPCEIELKRINGMIINRKILASDVLAISIQEQTNLVQETIKKKNYLFNVAIDHDGSISTAYQVSATPTVIFIDKDQTINWMTSGMSPTLEFRISSFLRP